MDQYVYNKLDDLDLGNDPTKSTTNMVELNDQIQDNRKRTIYGLKAKFTEPDYVALQPKLGQVPLNIAKKTLECTTQLATYKDVNNVRGHQKSRYSMLNRNRLSEKYATDTWYSSIKDESGATCCQIFTSMKSYFTYIVRIQFESEGPTALQTFIRQIGVPFTIRNNNSKMQTGKAFMDLLNIYNIGHETTEPHHPQQNPTEN